MGGADVNFDQSKLNAICDHYSIRPRRAAVRCEACGGLGILPSPNLGGIDCDCDHGIRVLDDGLLWERLRCWVHSQPREVRRECPDTTRAEDRYWWHWRNRRNQPWQSALEDAVLSYEVNWEPTGDDVLALMEAMEREEIVVGGSYWPPTKLHRCRLVRMEPHIDIHADAESKFEAVLRAALAICREEAT